MKISNGEPFQSLIGIKCHCDCPRLEGLTYLVFKVLFRQSKDNIAFQEMICQGESEKKPKRLEEQGFGELRQPHFKYEGWKGRCSEGWGQFFSMYQ